MSDNPTKYELLIEQYLRIKSVVPIDTVSSVHKSRDKINWVNLHTAYLESTFK